MKQNIDHAMLFLARYCYNNNYLQASNVATCWILAR